MLSLEKILACRALISQRALINNLNLVRATAPGCDVVAMVKADAYGHDMVLLSRLLAEVGVRHFGVATVEEAATLRRDGLVGELLLFGGATWLNQPDLLVAYDITPMISSLNELEALSGHIAIHLDIDTGMMRSGLLSDAVSELDAMLAFLKRHPKITVSGICTHFSHSDYNDTSHTQHQLELFSVCVERVISAGLRPAMVHVAKSSAIFQGYAQGIPALRILLPEARWAVRPGLALYGYSPFDGNEAVPGLQPVMAMQAPIVMRKQIKAGTPVGYSGTWIAPRDTLLALARMGYADGVNRLLSSRGHVLIGGMRAPIVGRVSMDFTAVDVTDVVRILGEEACQLGELVTMMPADEIAQIVGTIPYEVLTSVGSRVGRVVA